MASSISLAYHNLLEERRHNQATEGENIRANNLLDSRTREIADKDRASRESVASLDRASKVNIASADRASREKINAATLRNELLKVDRQASYNKQLQDEKYKYETNLQDARLANTIDLEQLKAYLNGDFGQQLGYWASNARDSGNNALANLIELIRIADAGSDKSIAKFNTASGAMANAVRAGSNVLEIPSSYLKAIGSILGGIGHIIPG